MEISVVVPVRDEAESIPILAAEIAAALEGLAWEVLWVDDGSADGTAEVLTRLGGRDPRHRPVSLARRQGQAAALVAGFQRARAARIVTLDGDLQNDPADIPSLLDLAARAPLDVVNGVRRRRRDSRLRRLSSRVANGFRNRVTGESLTDVGCSLRTFPTEAARRLPAFRGMHRFLPTLLRLQGCTVGEIEVAHRARRLGRTKYGVHNRLWVGIVDTFGVWWLQHRWEEPTVSPVSEPVGTAAARPAGVGEPVAGGRRTG